MVSLRLPAPRPPPSSVTALCRAGLCNVPGADAQHSCQTTQLFYFCFNCIGRYLVCETSRTSTRPCLRCNLKISSQKGICLGLYVVRRHMKSIKRLLSCTDGIYPHRAGTWRARPTPRPPRPCASKRRGVEEGCETFERPAFRGRNMARMWPPRHNVVRQAMNISATQNKKAPCMTTCTAPFSSQPRL